MVKAMLYRLGSYLVLCFFILNSLVFTSCSQQKAKKEPTTSNSLPYNLRSQDTLIALLQTGDVVLRAGLGPFSYMLANLNHKEKYYSHCGIVVVENGYPFVYHSIGGEDNADEHLRRDSASFFFSPLRNMGVALVRYDMEPATIKKLESIVTNYYKLRPLFDPQFDLKSDDKLYCSEFVYKAITKAMEDTAYITKSYGYDRVFVGVDDLYLNSHVKYIHKINYKQ